MKDSSLGRTRTKGAILIELVIAIGVLLLFLSATAMVGITNQRFAVDTTMDTEALAQAQSILAEARADAQDDFFSVLSSSTMVSSGNMQIVRSLEISDLTPCKKYATSSVLWQEDGTRPRGLTLATALVDKKGVLSLGGRGRS